jgi:hypothetical protein
VAFTIDSAKYIVHSIAAGLDESFLDESGRPVLMTLKLHRKCN